MRWGHLALGAFVALSGLALPGSAQDGPSPSLESEPSSPPTVDASAPPQALESDAEPTSSPPSAGAETGAEGAGLQTSPEGTDQLDLQGDEADLGAAGGDGSLVSGGAPGSSGLAAEDGAADPEAAGLGGGHPALTACSDSDACNPHIAEDQANAADLDDVPGAALWRQAQDAIDEPATWAGLGLAAAALALFHRFRKERDLRHPVRAALLSAVRERPGILASAIAEELGCSLNAVLHHVRVLRREGYVRIERHGHAGLLFPTDSPVATRRVRARLRGASARALLALAAAGGVTVAQAADRIGVTERAIRKQSALLAGEGLLAADRIGTTRLLVTTPEGARWLGEISGQKATPPGPVEVGRLEATAPAAQ